MFAETTTQQPPTDTEQVPLERVESELCTLAGQLAAATCRFMQLLAEFDSRRGWADWGLRSCAQWLSWRCGLDLRTAREQVRVARALAGLPAVRATFAEGRLSYSKVRAIARVATADTEEDLLHAALHSTASQLERLTRGLRRASHLDDAAESDAVESDPGEAGGPDTGVIGTDGQHGSRSAGAGRGVSWRWDDDGSLVLWGRLGAEEGARLLAGLTRAEALTAGDGVAEGEGNGVGNGKDAESGSAEPPRLGPDLAGRPPHNIGPGLVAMADLTRDSVDAPLFAPAAEVWVHTDADTLARATAQETSGTTGGRIDDGPPLTESAIARLACDGRIRLVVQSRSGATLDVGRSRRRPTLRQLMALWQRDRGCIVPGCEATRFLHAHHVQPWLFGGRTSVDNLVLLCGEHHRTLHGGDFSIAAKPGQRFDVYGRGGAHRPAAPTTTGTADALTTAHDHVGPDTVVPDWDGTALDLAHAVDCFLQSWSVRRESTVSN